MPTFLFPRQFTASFHTMRKPFHTAARSTQRTAHSSVKRPTCMVSTSSSLSTSVISSSTLSSSTSKLDRPCTKQGSTQMPKPGTPRHQRPGQISAKNNKGNAKHVNTCYKITHPLGLIFSTMGELQTPSDTTVYGKMLSRYFHSHHSSYVCPPLLGHMSQGGRYVITLV